MSNALTDVVADDLTTEYVARRAQDWEQRVRRLMDDLVSWIPQGWTVEERGTVPMDEEMMRQHGVPARRVPTLKMKGPQDQRAAVEPYGLWVVGSNGSLNLHAPTGEFVIVDRADSDLERPRPHWVIAPLRDRTRSQSLSSATFAEALGA